MCVGGGGGSLLPLLPPTWLFYCLRMLFLSPDPTGMADGSVQRGLYYIYLPLMVDVSVVKDHTFRNNQ